MPSKIQTVSLLNLSLVLENRDDFIEDDQKTPSIKKSCGRCSRTLLQLTPKGHHLKSSSMINKTNAMPTSLFKRMTVSQAHGFPLSPSALLERRSSETVFDFPSPPPSNIPYPYQFPPQTSNSPLFSATGSDVSTLSSVAPITPRHSRDEQFRHNTFDLTSKPLPDLPSIAFDDANFIPSNSPKPLAPTRTSSRRRTHKPMVSNTDDLPRSRSTYVSHIKSELSRMEAKKPSKGLNRAHRNNYMLSIMTDQEISFDTPIIVENVLSRTAKRKESNEFDSDGEEIPYETDFGLDDGYKEGSPDGAFSSSDEEEEYFEVLGPSRALDPIMSVISPRRSRPLHPPRQNMPSIYRKLSRSEPFLPLPCHSRASPTPSQGRPATPFPDFHSKQPQKASCNTSIGHTASSILAKLTIRKDEKEKNGTPRRLYNLPFTTTRRLSKGRSLNLMPSEPSFLLLS